MKQQCTKITTAATVFWTCAYRKKTHLIIESETFFHPLNDVLPFAYDMQKAIMEDSQEISSRIPDGRFRLEIASCQRVHAFSDVRFLFIVKHSLSVFTIKIGVDKAERFPAQVIWPGNDRRYMTFM
jgi:hypothetical protein